MRRAERVIAAAACLTALTGSAAAISHGGSPAPAAANRTAAKAPTEDEARAVLARLVEAAEQRNVDVFCPLIAEPDFCRRWWVEDGGSNAVPVRPPTVLGVRAQGRRVRVLDVCGLDGLARPYRSDVPVELFDGEPRALLGPYWRSMAYQGLYENTEPQIRVSEDDAKPPVIPPECLAP